MPLDHFVSQVHLRNFYSPALGERMHAIRKSDLKSFTCDSRSVCRIEDGSTNAYLINDRMIEKFLCGVEPKYNASVAKLREDKIDEECIYVIAGFAAFVASCSPAAMRIHTDPLQCVLKSTAVILDRRGLLPKAPPEFGGKSLSELLAENAVRIHVDPKYPQALGIDTINGRLSIWGNSRWEILRNDAPDCPFFTSDFPVVNEAINYRRMNWIFPLAPDIAIRIVSNVALSRTAPDFSFSKFNYRRRKLERPEILDINRLIVRCAEDTVFYRDNHEWVGDFVAKNRHYRVEAVTDQIPQGAGFLNISTQRIVPYRRDGQST